MAQRFSGKVCLITGAARGIGASLARAVAAEGGRVALVGLEPDLLEHLRDEIGDRAEFWVADVRDGEQVRAAVDAAAQHFGRLDYVVANAGIASYGTVRQLSDEAFAKVLDINVNGVFRTLNASVPHLAKTRGYALVVASLAAFTPLAGLAPYNASKAGAEALGLAFRQEVAHLGIDVGVCHPSWVDTDIVRGAEVDLPTFKAIRSKLPWPANSTTDVEECTRLMLRGMAKRKSRVYVPRSVAAANWAKALISSPLGWRLMRKTAAQSIPAMEEEVAALGRFHHAHVPTSEAD